DDHDSSPTMRGRMRLYAIPWREWWNGDGGHLDSRRGRSGHPRRRGLVRFVRARRSGDDDRRVRGLYACGGHLLDRRLANRGSCLLRRVEIGDRILRGRRLNRWPGGRHPDRQQLLEEGVSRVLFMLFWLIHLTHSTLPAQRRPLVIKRATAPFLPDDPCL